MLYRFCMSFCSSVLPANLIYLSVPLSIYEYLFVLPCNLIFLWLIYFFVLSICCVSTSLRLLCTSMWSVSRMYVYLSIPLPVLCILLFCLFYHSVYLIFLYRLSVCFLILSVCLLIFCLAVCISICVSVWLCLWIPLYTIRLFGCLIYLSVDFSVFEPVSSVFLRFRVSIALLSHFKFLLLTKISF